MGRKVPPSKVRYDTWYCLLEHGHEFRDPYAVFCRRLEDLVAHEDIIHIITNLVESDNLPHLLLYGPPGTGKTSTITAAAKKMYGKAYSSMSLELNASDARGIGVSSWRKTCT